MKNQFLLVASLLLATAFSACNNSNNATEEETKKEIGLQLYSVRHLLKEGAAYENNLAGLLDTLSKMGYTQVEAANYKDGKFYGMSPKEFAETAEAAGIKVLGSHAGRPLNADELKSGDLTEFKEFWAKTIDDHKELGVEYLVLPWMAVPEKLSDLEKQCNALNEVGAMAAEKGIKFGYHNHSHEFKKVEDNVMLDYMIEHTSPENVLFQLDVYWTVMGQASPVDYFAKYPGRFKLLHIKDRREIGQSGMVGFEAIFNNTDLAGTEDYFVEIEQYTDGIEKGVKESADYLKNAAFVAPSYKK